MSSESAINARVENLSHDEVQTSFHGIAARLDRLPSGSFQRKAMWLIGGVCFCDCLDMNVGGPIIAQLLASGWSDTALNSIFVSMTAFGYLCGGLMAGMVSDYFGRVKSCIVNTVIFSLGCFAAALSPDMYFLIAMRFVMGWGLGAAYPAGYSALTEYTPPKKRGQYQAWVGLIANCGTPFASFVSLVLLPTFGWRAIFIFCGVAGAIVVFLLIKFMDESPRWLAMRGRGAEADALVKKWEAAAAAAGHQIDDVPDDLIKAEMAKREVKQLPTSVLFTNKKLLKRLIVACVICWTNFVCVYTIVSWTPTIFVTRGFDVTMSVAMSVVINLGIPVGVFVMSMVIDKFNRKTLLCSTLVISAIACFAWSSIPANETIIIMVVGFIMAALVYFWSLIVSSVYLSEPFPTEVKVRGAGIANAFGRIGAILNPMWVAWFLGNWPTETAAMGIFGVSAITAVVAAIVVAVLGVETKGKTLEEINDGVFE
ncbi:MAG: MFS transporter [Coriobacteriia bacterium]|nr:MFS transporter [Coriobacteriia bacterium]